MWEKGERRGDSTSLSASDSSASDRDSPIESMTLLIGNLTREMTRYRLRRLFGKFGELVRVALFNEKCQYPWSSGYVEYKRRCDAEKALEDMNGVKINGCEIAVRFTVQQAGEPLGTSPRKGSGSPAGRARLPLSGRHRTSPQKGSGSPAGRARLPLSDRYRTSPQKGSGSPAGQAHLPLSDRYRERSPTRKQERSKIFSSGSSSPGKYYSRGDIKNSPRRKRR